VTLVDVELFAQGVLGKEQDQAAILLLRFLIALPIGALLGGWIATRVGDRAMAFVGLLIAAGGYWLISKWSVDLLSQHHNIFGLVSLPALDTDLAVAGLGLGLVIGPLTSASLRVVPSAQHGIASAAVVVARMTGMLIGVAALSAWEAVGASAGRREPGGTDPCAGKPLPARVCRNVWGHLYRHGRRLRGGGAVGTADQQPSHPCRGA